MSFTKCNIKTSWNCLRQFRVYSTKGSKPPQAAKPPPKATKESKPPAASKPPAVAKPAPAPKETKPPTAAKAPAVAKPAPAPKESKPPAATKPPAAAKPPAVAKPAPTPKESKPPAAAKPPAVAKPAPTPKESKPPEAAKPPAVAKPAPAPKETKPPAATKECKPPKPAKECKPPQATKPPPTGKESAPAKKEEPKKYKPRPKECECYNVGIVGVPFKMGQKKDGVEYGPLVIRAGLKGVLEKVQGVSKVKDYGDICSCGIQMKPAIAMGYGCKNLPEIGPLNKSLSEKVIYALGEQHLTMVLGGDHSIAVGSIHGHVTAVGKGKVGVIWVDAHADINTPATSGSGSVHGMPLSLLVEETRPFWPQNIPGLEWQKPVLNACDLAYIGLRDVDSWEKLIIQELNICAFDMKKVAVQGIGKVIKQAMAAIDPENNKSIHVSFDIDAIDAKEAPSTGTPVDCGLALVQGLRIMQAAFATRRLDVVDLVEVNPKLGSPEDIKKTSAAAVELILGACGKVVI